MKTQTRRSYYATLRYTVQGAERRVLQKLPGSGFTFGFKKGDEIDLMVMESHPEMPLICAVYLGRV